MLVTTLIEFYRANVNSNPGAENIVMQNIGVNEVSMNQCNHLIKLEFQMMILKQFDRSYISF